MRESAVHRKACGSCRGTTVAMLVRRQVCIRAPQSPVQAGSYSAMSCAKAWYAAKPVGAAEERRWRCWSGTKSVSEHRNRQQAGSYSFMSCAKAWTAIASKPAPTVLCHARKRCTPQSPWELPRNDGGDVSQAPSLYQRTAIASKPAPTVQCHARKRGTQPPANLAHQCCRRHALTTPISTITASTGSA